MKWLTENRKEYKELKKALRVMKREYACMSSKSGRREMRRAIKILRHRIGRLKRHPDLKDQNLIYIRID